jgi:hypothetical protein
LISHAGSIGRKPIPAAPSSISSAANGTAERELSQNLKQEAEAYWAAAKAGDTSKAVVFAGEGLDLIHDIKPAAEIVQAIADEAERLLNTRPGAVTS